MDLLVRGRIIDASWAGRWRFDGQEMISAWRATQCVE
jgi:hypothetical protein